MRFWFYTLRAIWRINRGRWHVWRDAPDDVVRNAASLAGNLRDSDEPSAQEAVRQAQAEFALRTAHNRRADMNKRTVLELARVAGLAESVDDYNPYWTADDTDTLERFAKLIAEHEREECAKAIDDSANICAPGPIQTVLREQARCIRSRT